MIPANARRIPTLSLHVHAVFVANFAGRLLILWLQGMKRFAHNSKICVIHDLILDLVPSLLPIRAARDGLTVGHLIAILTPPMHHRHQFGLVLSASSASHFTFSLHKWRAHFGQQPQLSESPPPGGAKCYRSAPAKTFQCAGYGECRMVFSRSEHLARHIRCVSVLYSFCFLACVLCHRRRLPSTGTLSRPIPCLPSDGISSGLS
jgi:hypothetical protein